MSSKQEYLNILESIIDDIFKPSCEQKMILNNNLLSLFNTLFTKKYNVQISIKNNSNINNNPCHHLNYKHVDNIETSIHVSKNNDNKQINLKLDIENNRKIQKDTKIKRSVANPFITFKSCVSRSIKDKIISEGLNITGKELIIEITKRASNEWSKLNDEDRAKYKKQALINKSHKNPPKILIDDYNDYNIKTENDEKDDYSTWVYNESLSVWVDMDNKLCYENRDAHASPIGQLNLTKIRYFNIK